MRLEEQLEMLAALGFEIESGSIEDLAADRNFLEEHDTVDYTFMTMGSLVSSDSDAHYNHRVRAFDFECIDSIEYYIPIIRSFCRMAGDEDWLKNIVIEADDEDEEMAQISYEVNGRGVSIPVEVNGDWADGMALMEVMSDIARDGNDFFMVDDGSQSVTYFYAPLEVAKGLAKITAAEVKGITSEEEL